MVVLPWILFVAVALLAQARLLAPLDEAALGWVVAHRWEGAADAMNWLFRLGFAQVGAAVAVVWSAYLLLQDVGRGAPPYTSRFPLHLLLPALAPLVLILGILLQAGLRLAVDQPAPDRTYELHRTFASEPVGLALDRTDALVRQGFVAATAPAAPEAGAGGRGSFPSGHATRVLFLALLAAMWPRGDRGTGRRLPLSLWERVRVRAPALSTQHPEPRTQNPELVRLALALLLSAAVGYSALYFGYHWPSDLLGGYLLAAALYPLAARLRDQRAS